MTPPVTLDEARARIAALPAITSAFNREVQLVERATVLAILARVAPAPAPAAEPSEAEVDRLCGVLSDALAHTSYMADGLIDAVGLETLARAAIVATRPVPPDALREAQAELEICRDFQREVTAALAKAQRRYEPDAALAAQEEPAAAADTTADYEPQMARRGTGPPLPRHPVPPNTPQETVAALHTRTLEEDQHETIYEGFQSMHGRKIFVRLVNQKDIPELQHCSDCNCNTKFVIFEVEHQPSLSWGNFAKANRINPLMHYVWGWCGNCDPG